MRASFNGNSLPVTIHSDIYLLVSFFFFRGQYMTRLGISILSGSSDSTFPFQMSRKREWVTARFGCLGVHGNLVF